MPQLRRPIASSIRRGVVTGPQADDDEKRPSASRSRSADDDRGGPVPRQLVASTELERSGSIHRRHS